MKQKRNFPDLAQQVIEQWKEGRSQSTNDNYVTALRSLMRFTKDRNILLGDVSEPLIKAYEHWLRSENVSLNTISCYMRSLRSLYRQTGGRGEPFRGVFTGNTKTEKRALNAEDILRLRRLNLQGCPQLEKTRDLFLFSIYALGMPFVDLANLRKQNFQGGFIVYKRHKTHQPIRIPVEPCMLDIIRKYAPPSGDYVFPIIQACQKGKSAYKTYQSALYTYNKRLKQLADKADIKANLTSYVARHTWASLAYERNVDLCVISKALGHTNTQTTQIYIREINDDRLAKANRSLLSCFLE